MVALLDGDAGGSTDPVPVELLEADRSAAGGLATDGSIRDGKPRTQRSRLVFRAAAAVAALVLAAISARSWAEDRAAAGTANLSVAGTRLHLASFQLPSVEVTLRNGGPRPLLLEGVDAAAGAARPEAGVLPLPVPAGGQVQVRLRFGNRCGTASAAASLAATVRTTSGTRRVLPLALTDPDAVQFLGRAVQAACAS